MTHGLSERGKVQLRVTLEIAEEETIRFYTVAERHEAQALIRQLAQALNRHEEAQDRREAEVHALRSGHVRKRAGDERRRPV